MPILKRNGKTFSGTPTKVDTAKSYTTFDSADDKNPTTWSDVELLTSKEEQRSLFSKISTMFKNIRYLYKMLGTTDISHYSDGTVTGAIKSACDNADSNKAAIADVNNKLGNTDISGIGDGTVTGGLSVLSNNAYDLKMLGWTVPKECPVQNYVDENGVFHQIVGRVDLSKLMWEWVDTLNEFRTDLYIMGMNPYSTNIYCSKYQFGSEMYLSGMGIYIKDPNYDSSTISQFKADNKGVYFYYELATEITKPVDGNESIKLLNDKLGNTDISAIGDGTLTGGLDALNSKLGNTDISAIGDGTVTGGLNALNSNLSKVGVPDYAHARLLDNTLSNITFEFTAPSNGFVTACGYGENQSTSYIQFIYNQNQNIRKAVQGVSDESISAQMTLSKGDTITINTCLSKRNNGTYFVPYKE